MKSYVRSARCAGYASLALIMLALAGCVVEPPPQRPGPPPQALVRVQAPPPAEVVEVQPPPPGPAEIWVWQRGHWRWNGAQYIWARGHWAERPAYAHEWVAPHWEPHPQGGYIFIEGAWR
jgi:hypothetical protein